MSYVLTREFWKRLSPFLVFALLQGVIIASLAFARKPIDLAFFALALWSLTSLLLMFDSTLEWKNGRYWGLVMLTTALLEFAALLVIRFDLAGATSQPVITLIAGYSVYALFSIAIFGMVVEYRSGDGLTMREQNALAAVASTGVMFTLAAAIVVRYGVVQVEPAKLVLTVFWPLVAFFTPFISLLLYGERRAPQA